MMNSIVAEQAKGPMHRSTVLYCVRVWWAERIVDGCQYKYLGETIEDIDWKGEERWKRLTTVHSLHCDFQNWARRPVPINEFGKAFKVIANPDKVRKHCYAVTHGGVRWKTRVSYYRWTNVIRIPPPV